MAVTERMVLQFSPTLTAKVHPLVIFNICDCYVRRPDQTERVIGTLLGSVLPDGIVDIRNSYVVPHSENSEQVALDIEYHHNMLISQQKVNPKEVIVGWYSTGLGVTGCSVLIHEFYSSEVPNPVHLTVDTGFSNGEGAVKAYVSSTLSLSHGETRQAVVRQAVDRQLPLAAQFQEIPLDLRMVEAEQVGSPASQIQSKLRDKEIVVTERTVLQFSPTLTAKVHPLVIFNICDCYVRRPDQTKRVIGTLLGSVLPDGTVDIQNSYAVPHSENSEQSFSLWTTFVDDYFTHPKEDVYDYRGVLP